MYKDPIVEEIRKIREEYAAKFNYDLHAIFEDIKKHDKELVKKGWKLVSLPIVNSKTAIEQTKTIKRNKRKT